MLKAILLLVFMVAAVPAGAAERPNILWLTCEDMGPHLGCYGDSYSQSPTIDALAARGMRYTNASSICPVCAPARTTIISGLYAASTGAEHMRSQSRLPKGFRMFPQYLREAGYYCTNNLKEDYNLAKPGEVWDKSSAKAHWRNRPKGAPFFAVFNDTITHESQIRNEIDSKDKVHDPAKVTVPGYHPDTPEVRRDWAQYYDRITMMDSHVAERLKELEDAGLADDTIVFFFSDHGSGMPRNKRWLYQTGLRVPMVVYFPPKWRHLAPKDYQEGGTSDRLVSFVDLAPTVLNLAGVETPEWMQGGAFAGEQQADAPQYSYGLRARMDERYDLLRSVRDKQYKYIRNYMPQLPYGQNLAYQWQTPTTVVWERLFKEGELNDAQASYWKQKPPEELYDMEADPEESRNLVDSAEHRDVLERMRKAHHDWARAIKDIDLLPEWEMQKRAEGSSPYEVGHDPKKYDFEAVFAAAQMASARRPEDLPKLIELFASKDRGVRYWAAMGILAQESAGVAGARDVLVTALDDDSPNVRIVAAEALGRFGSEADAAKGLDALVSYLDQPGDYLLAVAAWNALDALDERALPAIKQIRKAPAHWDTVPPRMGEYPARLRFKTLEDLKK